MIVVDDDIAQPDLPQARGLAGTLFVHKIAGALAEDGADLEAVTRAARLSSPRPAPSACRSTPAPCRARPRRRASRRGKAELGLGIHGEAGIEQVDYTDARTAIAMVCDRLGPLMGDGPQVAILNNLGGASVLEMSVLANELARSSIAGRLGHVVGPAALMTSLEMRGFSVSVYPATPEDLVALQAPTPLAAWPGVNRIGAVKVVPLPDGLRPSRPLPSDHPATRALLTRCCAILIASEGELNALDARSGDGDTGSTLATGARAILAGIDRLPLADHPRLWRAIGEELGQTVGGSSGVLLAIFFTATGDAASSGLALRDSLAAGLARLKEVGGAEVGDRTMVDALQPALDALAGGLPAAAAAARRGAERTAGIVRARAGRASYLSADQIRGHVDPGAEAVARLFEQLCDPTAGA